MAQIGSFSPISFHFIPNICDSVNKSNLQNGPTADYAIYTRKIRGEKSCTTDYSD